MKALNLLRKDHRVIKTLLARLVKTREEAVERRRHLFEMIRQRLVHHSQIERSVFYPALREVPVDNASMRVEQAVKDQLRIDAVLLRISQHSSQECDADLWTQLLAQVVERHVQDEEADLFILAKTRLSPVQLKELGRKMEEMQFALHQPASR